MSIDRHWVSISPLLPSENTSEFISKLSSEDIWARFGRMLEAARLASLIVPDRAGVHALGAWEKSSLVGTAMIVDVGHQQCELAVLIRSDLKRLSIGTALTCHACALARDLGASEMIAHARTDNIAALKLLQKTGFHPASGFEMERWYAANLNMRGTFDAS